MTTGTAQPQILPVASARETARVVGRLLGQRRGRLAVIVLLLLAASAATLVVPRALGAIVDAVAADAPLSELLGIAGVIAGAGALGAALAWWGGRLLVECLQEVVAHLRESVFDTALALDSGNIESAGSGDVVSRITRDVEAVTEASAGVLPQFTQAGFTIALTLVGLAALDPMLALAALVAAPVQVGATRWFVRRSRPLYARLRKEESARGQSVIEAVTGARTVQAYRRQGSHLDEIAVRSLRAVETGRDATRVRNRFFSGLNSAEFLGLAAVLAVGFWRSEAGVLTVGEVTAGALYFHRLFGPIGALLGSVDDLQRASVGLERLVGVIGAEVPGPTHRTVTDASVTVRGFSFGYAPGTDVLHDIDLRLEAGTTTVFVGVSGSGKSTLARAIAGLLPTERGEVQVGGVPAVEARRADGRPAVVLVTQEVHVFAGSVADNLRLGRPGATDAELREALAAVGARWVLESEDQIATAVDADLHEGRVQQLALARVLLADPPVLVLDEATAHAGTGSESLDDAVEVVSRNRTTIIVAHRLSQAKDADLIVAFEDGRIAEAGTHEQLLARGDGPFAQLWRAWTSVAR